MGIELFYRSPSFIHLDELNSENEPGDPLLLFNCVLHDASPCIIHSKLVYSYFLLVISIQIRCELYGNREELLQVNNNDKHLSA